LRSSYQADYSRSRVAGFAAKETEAVVTVSVPIGGAAFLPCRPLADVKKTNYVVGFITPVNGAQSVEEVPKILGDFLVYPLEKDLDLFLRHGFPPFAQRLYRYATKIFSEPVGGIGYC